MFRAFAFVSLLFAVGCVAPSYLVEPTMVVVRGRPPAPPPEPAPAPPPRLERIVVTDTIEFETNLDVLRSESKQVLDGVATTIKQHPELIKIRVEGHTDSEGKSSDNLVLSRKRAIAVRAYLIGRGVEASRLIAEGYGDTNPVAENSTTTGRRKNRRVAFTILDRTDGAS